MLEIIFIPIFNDNYSYVLHDPQSMQTAVVDPALAQPVLDVLDSKGWTLNYIFNTHHHSDHIGGNHELKQKTGCKIVAAANDRHNIPGIDMAVSDGDTLYLGGHTAQIIATPGHTNGHIVYHFAEDNLLFCGDTLFAMGCGRLFEGSAVQLWQSLQKLKQLPPTTKIYCAHEYTQNNGRFALSLEPNNQNLQKRMADVELLRQTKQPTLPSTIAEELATNPFFRELSPELQANLGMADQSPVEIFTQIRRLKDCF